MVNPTSAFKNTPETNPVDVNSQSFILLVTCWCTTQHTTQPKWPQPTSASICLWSAGDFPLQWSLWFFPDRCLCAAWQDQIQLCPDTWGHPVHHHSLSKIGLIVKKKNQWPPRLRKHTDRNIKCLNKTRVLWFGLHKSGPCCQVSP